MRNFIDIISKNLVSAAPLPAILNETALMEAKNFDAMFNGLEAMAQRYDQPVIHETIASCKILIKSLKRNDRQAWAARLLRLWMIDNMSGWSLSTFSDTDLQWMDGARAAAQQGEASKKEKFEVFQSEVAKLANKYLNDYQKTMGVDYKTDMRGSDPTTVIKRSIIAHYLGMPFSKIQNYVFSKSVTETLADLAALEKEFSERAKGLLTMHEGDQIAIRMANNFIWVLLGRGYCDEEAKVMGHCGNAGARSGDRILSMRRIKDTIDGEIYMEVFLTFILAEDGYLGEMKGRANDKPAERYHPQIIELLKNPIIKGIRGGGYKPQNNFSLNDLPDDVREELLDKFPHLGNWQARLAKAIKAGGVSKQFVAELLTAVKESHDWTGSAEIVDEGIAVKSWDEIDDLVEEMSKDEHTKEVSSSDFFPDFSDGVSDDDVENLIDELPTRWQIALGQYTLDAMTNAGADEDDIEYFDPSSSSEVVEKLGEYAEDVKDALENAVRYGRESGAQAEAHELLVQAIKDFKPIKGKLVFSTYEKDGETNWVWDSPVRVVLSLEDAAAFVDETQTDDWGETPTIEEVLFGEDAKIEIDEPYYGYTEFDNEYAIERFAEEVDLGELEPTGTKPLSPDFDEMDITAVKAWLEEMYEKIPDGFVRKVHPDTMADDRIRASAKGLFKTYWG